MKKEDGRQGGREGGRSGGMMRNTLTPIDTYAAAGLGLGKVGR